MPQIRFEMQAPSCTLIEPVWWWYQYVMFRHQIHQNFSILVHTQLFSIRVNFSKSGFVKTLIKLNYAYKKELLVNSHSIARTDDITGTIKAGSLTLHKHFPTDPQLAAAIMSSILFTLSFDFSTSGTANLTWKLALWAARPLDHCKSGIVREWTIPVQSVKLFARLLNSTQKRASIPCSSRADCQMTQHRFSKPANTFVCSWHRTTRPN